MYAYKSTNSPKRRERGTPMCEQCYLATRLCFYFFFFVFYLISKVFSRKKKNVLKYATNWVNLKNYTKQKKVAK